MYRLATVFGGSDCILSPQGLSNAPSIQKITIIVKKVGMGVDSDVDYKKWMSVG